MNIFVVEKTTLLGTWYVAGAFTKASDVASHLVHFRVDREDHITSKKLKSLECVGQSLPCRCSSGQKARVTLTSLD